MKKNKAVDELLKERKLNSHQKYLVRGIGLSFGGFLILLIPYITFIAPFALVFGGWYLAKWYYKVDVEERIKESIDDEHPTITNKWNQTDNGN